MLVLPLHDRSMNMITKQIIKQTWHDTEGGIVYDCGGRFVFLS